MKKNNIQVVCRLSETLMLGLAGIRENMGHDDCLPYQAEVFIYDKDNNADGSMAFQKIGNVWNDGWGGPSCLQPAGPKAADYIAKVRDLCAKHQMYWKEKPISSYKPEDVCEDIANLFLNSKKEFRTCLMEFRFDDDPVVRQRKGHPNLFFYTQT